MAVISLSLICFLDMLYGISWVLCEQDSDAHSAFSQVTVRQMGVKLDELSVMLELPSNEVVMLVAGLCLRLILQVRRQSSPRAASFPRRRIFAARKSKGCKVKGPNPSWLKSLFLCAPSLAMKMVYFVGEKEYGEKEYPFAAIDTDMMAVAIVNIGRASSAQTIR